MTHLRVTVDGKPYVIACDEAWNVRSRLGYLRSGRARIEQIVAALNPAPRPVDPFVYLWAWMNRRDT